MGWRLRLRQKAKKLNGSRKSRHLQKGKKRARNMGRENDMEEMENRSKMHDITDEVRR